MLSWSLRQGGWSIEGGAIPTEELPGLFCESISFSTQELDGGMKKRFCPPKEKVETKRNVSNNLHQEELMIRKDIFVRWER